MRHREFWEQIPFSVDLPTETLPGQPLVELAGDRRVLIENHLGIIAYGSCETCVKVKYGSVQICGSCLEIAKMTKQQLVITGCIDTISLHRRR